MSKLFSLSLFLAIIFLSNAFGQYSEKSGNFLIRNSGAKNEISSYKIKGSSITFWVDDRVKTEIEMPIDSLESYYVTENDLTYYKTFVVSTGEYKLLGRSYETSEGLFWEAFSHSTYNNGNTITYYTYKYYLGTRDSLIYVYDTYKPKDDVARRNFLGMLTTSSDIYKRLNSIDFDYSKEAVSLFFQYVYERENTNPVKSYGQLILFGNKKKIKPNTRMVIGDQVFTADGEFKTFLKMPADRSVKYEINGEQRGFFNLSESKPLIYELKWNSSKNEYKLVLYDGIQYAQNSLSILPILRSSDVNEL